MSEWKTCSACKKHKSVVYFYRKGTTGKYRSSCVPCTRAKEKARRANGADKNLKLLREYGITYQQYCQMLVDQEELCAICLEPESMIDKRTGQPRELCVDHCHRTGRVRRLLCNRCNILVGHMEKSAERTWAALTYLVEQELSGCSGNNDTVRTKYGKGLVKDA